MSNRRQVNKAGHLAPALFPFVTLRKERFGAILFNPYLSAEEQLDTTEALIAGMCGGTYSINEIREELCVRLNLPVDHAERKLDETIARLNRVCSLQFIEKKLAPSSLKSAEARPDSTAWFSSPKSVIWDVTYLCNLKCPHCLTDSGHRITGELDTKDALRLVDKLAEAKVMYLSLSGGEPFLRHDILQILKHIAHSGLRVDIASNGFSIPLGIVKALRDLPVFHIQVSIDGIGEKHDRFRGKPGAFEKSCRTLRRLKKEGFSTSISTTATAMNIDHLADLIDLAVALGCESFKAIPFIPAGRGKRHDKELCLSPEGALKLSRTLAEKKRELAGRLNLSTETGFLFLLDRPIASQTGGGPMTCSAGYDSLSIGADGTVFPCPFLRDFPMGNALTDSICGIWHESSILKQLRTLNKDEMTGPCGSCEFAPMHCHGGCRAAAYLACGDLKGSDPLCFKDLPSKTNCAVQTRATLSIVEN